MSVTAFVVIAFMLTVYVLLDGYDLGVATIVPLIGRSARGRDAVLASIGPFWNGNEVWLVGSIAALFALFPEVYASALSGFYLPFVVALWLLMFRGIALDLRRHLPSEIWRQFWMRRCASRARCSSSRLGSRLGICCAACRSILPGTFKARLPRCSIRTRCWSAYSPW